MFKVMASDLCTALDCVSFGGGKGFKFSVSPIEQDLGNGVNAPVATISCSDGNKTANTSVIIQPFNMDKTIEFYTTASIRPAVTTLSKITEKICFELKGKSLALYDEAEESVIKVDLMENDKELEIPEPPVGSIIFNVEREKFAEAIRLGGYASTESNTAEHMLIGFQVLEEDEKLVILSRRGEVMCRAKVAISDLEKKSAEAIVPQDGNSNPENDSTEAIVPQDGNSNPENDITEENGQKKKIPWHMVNYKFIKSLVTKLNGDVIQILITPKFMMVFTVFAVFAFKKSGGTVTKATSALFENMEYDYSGQLDKKNLLLGLEIATAGVEGKFIFLETNENGTLHISSNEGNKTNILQKSYEGKLEQKCFATEFLQLVLKGCGDELHYFGKKENPSSNIKAEKAPLMAFDGTENGVEYISVLAPVNKKRKTK